MALTWFKYVDCAVEHLSMQVIMCIPCNIPSRLYGMDRHNNYQFVMVYCFFKGQIMYK